MSPRTVEAVIDAAGKHWDLANDIEITLEANPGSVEAGRFADFRTAGVNRVSVGIQALNDKDLKRLGRLHSADEGKRALATAGQVFDRFSFDLIYARQDQSLDDWHSELSAAIRIGADHMSLYQLTIEDGTAFGTLFKHGKLAGLPDEDLGADMYDLTQDMMQEAGYRAYEVSNHAREGAESKHNQIYWDAGDWIGIGPGAHGRLTIRGERHATETALSPNGWLDAVAKGSGELQRTRLSPEDASGEYLMMGLRTETGVEFDRISSLANTDFMNKIRYLTDIGLIEAQDNHLKTTAKGRPILNAIVRDLLPD